MYEVRIEQGENTIVLESNKYEDIELIASTVLAISEENTVVKIRNKIFSKSEHLARELHDTKDKIRKVECYVEKEIERGAKDE